MKKTAVLSTVALAIGLGSATSGFAADNRIGVTIYKYDDNFMSLMRKEIDKECIHRESVKSSPRKATSYFFQSPNKQRDIKHKCN